MNLMRGSKIFLQLKGILYWIICGSDQTSTKKQDVN
jgi:hypothetical protein